MRGAAYAGIAAPPGVHTQLVFTLLDAAWRWKAKSSLIPE